MIIGRALAVVAAALLASCATAPREPDSVDILLKSMSEITPDKLWPERLYFGSRVRRMPDGVPMRRTGDGNTTVTLGNGTVAILEDQNPVFWAPDIDVAVTGWSDWEGYTQWTLIHRASGQSKVADWVESTPDRTVLLAANLNFGEALTALRVDKDGFHPVGAIQGSYVRHDWRGNNCIDVRIEKNTARQIEDLSFVRNADEAWSPRDGRCPSVPEAPSKAP